MSKLTDRYRELYPPNAKCKRPIETAIKALCGEIAELEAIVEKLPLTADGVRMVPGEIIFSWDTCQEIEEVALEISLIGDPLRLYSRGDCFSTREAAEAALKEASQ